MTTATETRVEVPPFRDVSNSSGGGDYAEFIEPGRYLLKLVRFEDLGVSTFAEPGDPNPPHSIRWAFLVARPDSSTEPLLGMDGQRFELFGYTSTATGKKSKARPWLQALLGRELSEGEKGADLAREALGRKAWAMLDHKVIPGEQGSQDRTTVVILSLSPYKEGEKPGRAAAPPAKAPAPPNAAEPVADDDSLPF